MSIFSTLLYVSSNPVHDWSSAHITQLLQPLHWLPIRLRNLISVLPPSRYDLRRNNEGIFLSTPKRFTKVTMVDRSFMAVAGHGFGTVFPCSIRSDCAKSDFKQIIQQGIRLVQLGCIEIFYTVFGKLLFL